jgi:hypothetical protein
MLDHVMLPPELRSVIGTESKDFAAKARRTQPVKMSMALIAFGTIWLAFSSIFVIAFLGPLFVGDTVYFTANDVPTEAGPGNYGPIVLPAIIIGIFVLVGLLMVGFGIYSLMKKGGYFVGTPTRLISFQDGAVRSIDWEQFSGDIEMKGDDMKGDLTLQMRSGRMVSSKSGSDRYVPDTIYMSGIAGLYEVEKICRKRIKENDPTPVIPEDSIS